MADIAALTALIEPEAKALGFDLVRVIMFGGDDPDSANHGRTPGNAAIDH